MLLLPLSLFAPLRDGTLTRGSRARPQSRDARACAALLAGALCLACSGRSTKDRADEFGASGGSGGDGGDAGEGLAGHAGDPGQIDGGSSEGGGAAAAGTAASGGVANNAGVGGGDSGGVSNAAGRGAGGSAGQGTQGGGAGETADPLTSCPGVCQAFEGFPCVGDFGCIEFVGDSGCFYPCSCHDGVFRVGVFNDGCVVSGQGGTAGGGGS